MTYAQSTNTSTDRSLVEMKNALLRYKATGFGYMERTNFVTVGFEMRGRAIRFSVNIPTVQDCMKTPTGKTRSLASAQTVQQQTVRQRYRALLLVIKAKLEAIESGIETFEEAFMAQLVLPGGQTMSEHIIPKLPEIYRTGDTKLMLGSGS